MTSTLVWLVNAAHALLMSCATMGQVVSLVTSMLPPHTYVGVDVVVPQFGSSSAFPITSCFVGTAWLHFVMSLLSGDRGVWHSFWPMLCSV